MIDLARQRRYDHADMGGMSEIYQEGRRIPVVRLFRRGETWFRRSGYSDRLKVDATVTDTPHEDALDQLE